MSLPRIGKPAPYFSANAIVDNKLTEISLSDYKDKYVILLFMPFNSEFIDAAELISFNNHLKEFKDMNTYVIACSVISQYYYLKLLETSSKENGIAGTTIPLITDKSMDIVQRYGVLDEKLGTPYRAMFIIGWDGILRQITINDHHVSRSMCETQRLVETIQEADKLRRTSTKLSFPEILLGPARSSLVWTWSDSDFRIQITE